MLHSIFRFLLIQVILLCSLSPGAFAYQLVFDGEDTAFHVRQGTWNLDKTGTYQGNYRFSVGGPGMGANVLDWDIDGIPPGTYRIDFYVDGGGNYAENAEFIIRDETGTTTVTRSQYMVAGGWYSLGVFDLGKGSGRVTQTDRWTGRGTKVIADALRVTWMGTNAPQPPVGYPVKPEVTIVVDDLGTYNPYDSSTYTAQLFDQAPGFDYAVMPFQAYTVSTLEAAAAMGIKTILHQPMQYYTQDGSSAGSDTVRLYTNLSNAVNLSRLNANLANVAPYVEGLNNHQGSLFSEYVAGMQLVVDELKSRGMYFLDSRTISDAVGYDLAKKVGMLTGERDLFVDGSSIQNTKDLIKQVAQQAIYQPNLNYIMICHQRPATVPGLIQVLPELEAMGVTLKSLERNLHYIVELDNLPPGAAVDLTGTWTTAPDLISHELTNGFAKESVAAGATATFRPVLPKDGMYRVFVSDPAEISVVARNGTFTTSTATLAGYEMTWNYAGTYQFNAGAAASVKLLAPLGGFGGGAKLRADAVKFVWDAPLPNAGVAGWELY